MRYLLLSLVVSLCLALQQAPAKQDDQRQAQKSAKNERGTDQSPLIVKMHASEEEKNEATHREKRKAENEEQLVTWTMVLAGIGFLQFMVFIGQGVIFGLQAKRLKETIEEMKIATEATKNAADAAQTSAAAAIASSKAYQFAERAWVSISEVKPRDFTHGIVESTGEIKNGTIFEINWRNAGRTPALRCQSFCTGAVIYPPYPQSIPSFTPSDESGGATLIPGAIAISPRWHLYEEDRAKLRDRQCRAFLYGRATYEDVFANGQRHAEVCMEIEFAGDISTGGMLYHFSVVGPQNSAS